MERYEIYKSKSGKIGAIEELEGKEREAYEAYRKIPLMSECAKAIGISLKELEWMRYGGNGQVDEWFKLAEREFRDKVERMVMARSGVLGEEEYKASQGSNTKELLALIRSKDFRYAEGSRALGKQNNTQINADKVVIEYNNKGNDETITAD